jgi:hypothetical protein
MMSSLSCAASMPATGEATISMSRERGLFPPPSDLTYRLLIGLGAGYGACTS